MADRPLTDQQNKVLQYVQDYTVQRGFSPTLREIGQAIGLANVNAVRGHLTALERKGYITKESDKARTIRLVDRPSVLSQIKRKLHQWARTDQGVLHHVIYGLAWATRGALPVLEGPVAERLAAGIDREALEHGWTILQKQIEPDHVRLVLKVWPNHSPDQTVHRLRHAVKSLSRPPGLPGPPAHWWGKGYVITTQPDQLEEMARKLVEEEAGRREKS